MLVLILNLIMSLGAVNALIPIIVILILLVASAGLNRGYSVFNLFGLSTLAGINPGGKASVAGKTSFIVLLFGAKHVGPHLHPGRRLKGLGQKMKARAGNTYARLANRYGRMGNYSTYVQRKYSNPNATTVIPGVRRDSTSRLGFSFYKKNYKSVIDNKIRRRDAGIGPVNRWRSGTASKEARRTTREAKRESGHASRFARKSVAAGFAVASPITALAGGAMRRGISRSYGRGAGKSGNTADVKSKRIKVSSILMGSLKSPQNKATARTAAFAAAPALFLGKRVGHKALNIINKKGAQDIIRTSKKGGDPGTQAAALRSNFESIQKRALNGGASVLYRPKKPNTEGMSDTQARAAKSTYRRQLDEWKDWNKGMNAKLHEANMDALKGTRSTPKAAVGGMYNLYKAGREGYRERTAAADKRAAESATPVRSSGLAEGAKGAAVAVGKRMKSNFVNMGKDADSGNPNPESTPHARAVRKLIELGFTAKAGLTLDTSGKIPRPRNREPLSTTHEMVNNERKATLLLRSQEEHLRRTKDENELRKYYDHIERELAPTRSVAHISGRATDSAAGDGAGVSVAGLNRIKQTIALNPNTPHDIVRGMALHDDNAGVRAAALRNSSLTQEELRAATERETRDMASASSEVISAHRFYQRNRESIEDDIRDKNRQIEAAKQQRELLREQLIDSQKRVDMATDSAARRAEEDRARDLAAKMEDRTREIATLDHGLEEKTKELGELKNRLSSSISGSLSDHNATLSSVAAHPETDPKDLEKIHETIAATHDTLKSSGVFDAAGKDPFETQQARSAEASIREVKQELIKNKNTPTGVLEALSHDDNNNIKKMASSLRKKRSRPFKRGSSSDSDDSDDASS